MTRVVCIMINGTVPLSIGGRPRFRWMEPDAPIVRALRERLDPDVVFDTFEWNGRNSHRARVLAARELAERLAHWADRKPSAPLILLAHSHGATVALYAVRSHLELVPRCSVIALGTTFMIPKGRYKPLVPGQGRSDFKFQMGSIFSLPLFYFVMNRGGAESFVGFLFGLAVAAAPIYCVPWRRIDVRIREWVRRRRRQLLGELSIAASRPLSVLNVVIKGDEAGWWLGSQRVISEASFRGAWILARISLFLAAVTMIIAPLVAPAVPFADNPIIGLWVLWGAIVGVPLLMLVVPIVIATVLSITRGSPWGFGESLVDGLLVDLTLTKSPPTAGRGTGTLSYKAGGLASRESGFRWLVHSRVLSSPTIAKRIGSWVKQWEAGEDAASGDPT